MQVINPFFKSNDLKADTTAPTQVPSEANELPTPTETILPKPTSLTIPKLNLNNIEVEYVGLDQEGKMDVPKNPNNVAWFELGYKPGKNGNSVLAGHFDKEDGSPAVFYKLDNLDQGDKITLATDDGKEKTFVVRDKALYKLSEFPTEFVFGKSDKKMLNLITCDGTWDPTKKSYSNRLVVFTELEE